jgi:hypothetical protein
MFPHALGFRIRANGSTRRRIAGTMNHYIRTFAILTVLGLSGCPVTQVNRIPESSPLPRATEITAAGDFSHKPSGYVFPIQVGAFQRVDLLQYDTGGLDVSAGYNDALPGCLVALTSYVYPTPRMQFIGADPNVVRSIEERWLEGGYTRAKEEITGAHPEAVLESEGARKRDGVPGKKALYSIGKAESELEVFVVQHSWFLKFRATYPSQCATQAREAMDAFHTAWNAHGS